MKRVKVLVLLTLLFIFDGNSVLAENLSANSTSETIQSAESLMESESIPNETENSRITSETNSTIESSDLTQSVSSEESSSSQEINRQQKNGPLSIDYRSYLNGTGWQAYQKNGAVSGTEKQNQQIEAIQIKSNDIPEDSWIEYSSHIEGSGWETIVKKDGETSGKAGKRVEAFRVSLKGELAKTHQIYYRAKVKAFGWLNWTTDGEIAGSSGCAYPIEAFQVMLVEKNETKPSGSGLAYIEKPKISYSTHVQSIGWQSAKQDGQTSGTTGQAKRLEAIKVSFSNLSGNQIEYKTHIQNIGWESNFKSNNQISGTSGQAKRLEAIQIRLASSLNQYFDVYYRVHAQNLGWMDWAKDGDSSGTTGFAYRLEGIQIKIVPKGQAAPGSTSRPHLAKPVLSYQTHVQTYGWQGYKNEKSTSGTTGQAKRLEAIQMKLNASGLSGTVQYRTHISNIGWESSYRQAGQISGTTGQAKRLEAIQIKLTGELATYFDIYYHVHAETFGWMGWAKNGQSAGTSGYAKRLEAIQIALVPKGQAAPGGTSNAFRNGKVLLNVPFYDQYKAGAPYGCEAASLLQGLHYKGKAKNYNLQSFIKVMPIDPSNNPNKGFAGSPYKSIYGIYQSIYPKPLAAWGKKYGNVVDISGATVTSLKSEMANGNPIVVYVTSGFKDPVYHRYFFGVGIDNAHVMTLDGYDERAGKYHVSDPVSGKYWVNKGSFEKIYNLKHYAVAIRG
ncbi:C39 family peptidase [Enterococcus raffinosus]|uniref:C39 family peptidase n=1 Tax=Enterococcus raffinosus TaxID=71452 RepID=UPI001C0F926C|nr:C39 family peptidase [Enterococcus raffinosus]MBU5361436.1 C39 family peptidase [Enterococcus raffinosus]